MPFQASWVTIIWLINVCHAHKRGKRGRMCHVWARLGVVGCDNLDPVISSPFSLWSP